MTINDIARLANTSKSTVSRILAGNDKVNKNTRDKVLQVIDEYNYHPNSLARSLASGKMNVVSVIVPNLQNPFYSSVVWYIERELYNSGYHMFLYCSNNDTEKESVCFELTRQNSFAGIIIISPVGKDYLKQESSNPECPVILLNRFLDDFPGDVLTVNNFEAAYAATEFLIEIGHRKLAVLSAETSAYTHSERLFGFRQALKENDIDFSEKFHFIGDLSFEGCYKIGEHILSMGSEMPTAVFCTSDIMAIGMMQTLKFGGIRIPQDISVIGFDDIPMAQLAGIDLTTVRQPYEQIGVQAVNMLIHRMHNAKDPYRQITLNCELIKRNSTAAPNRTNKE